jgi:hypothetical protein
MEFPTEIKIGRTIYEISGDDTYLNGDMGVIIEGDPTIYMDLDTDTPGEVLLHEICHAIEDAYNLRILWNSPRHTAFIKILYTVLRENNLLSERLYGRDRIEER